MSADFCRSQQSLQRLERHVKRLFNLLKQSLQLFEKYLLIIVLFFALNNVFFFLCVCMNHLHQSKYLISYLEIKTILDSDSDINIFDIFSSSSTTALLPVYNHCQCNPTASSLPSAKIKVDFSPMLQLVFWLLASQHYALLPLLSRRSRDF